MNENQNIEKDIHSRYIFWVTDPAILYNDQNYLKFFPTAKMTRVQQLNAITRFCIYFLILALMFQKCDLWLQIPVIVIVFIIMVYYIFENDTEGKQKETYRSYRANFNPVPYNNNKKYNTSYDISNNVDNYNEKDAIVESGYYDSNGRLRLGPHYGINSKYGNNNKKKYPISDYDEYKRMTCRRPTVDNPFMNPTINDYDKESVPEACNVDDDQIKDSITTCFNKNLFRDVSDVFEVENSQRQFYTVPQINPPDQTKFANWLYNTDDICKVNNSKCLKYEDLRFKRQGMKW
jgi:hypothetical protein